MLINIFMFNFFLSIILILLFRKIFLKFKPKGFFVEKGARKIVKVGGVVIFLSFLIMSLLFYPNLLFLNSLALWIIFSSFLVLSLGLIDDWRELKVWQKFLGEVVITIFFLIASGMTTEIIFFPKAINFIITLIWILGITNAFNLLDIQDGLATGVGFLISLAFLYLASLTGNSLVGQFSLLLASSLLAVFLFNFPPAKMYLGDAGSLFLGFVFSILAISISYAKSYHEMALLSPFFILGLPIFDMIFVIIRRMFNGKSIFRKSDDHFILCLIAAGKKKLNALFICYFMTLVFITLGILFTKLSNLYSLILILITLIFLILVSFRVGIIKV